MSNLINTLAWCSNCRGTFLIIYPPSPTSVSIQLQTFCGEKKVRQQQPSECMILSVSRPCRVIIVLSRRTPKSSPLQQQMFPEIPLNRSNPLCLQPFRSAAGRQRRSYQKRSCKQMPLNRFTTLVGLPAASFCMGKPIFQNGKSHLSAPRRADRSTSRGH